MPDGVAVEVAAGKAQTQWLAWIPGEIRHTSQFEHAGKSVELAAAKADLDALSERETPSAGNLVTQIRRSCGCDVEGCVQREISLVFGHGRPGNQVPVVTSMPRRPKCDAAARR